jgi:hypothetical protein
MNNQKVYFMDFSSLNTREEIFSCIAEAKQAIRCQPPASVYALTNLEKMHFDSEIKEAFTDFTRGNKPYIKSSAVVGIDTLQRILFNAIMKLSGRDIRVFANLEEAKFWLIDKTLR